MKPNFTVIKGGKSFFPECRDRKFISGYSTNTRLMGVIGLELKWEITTDSDVRTLNQIFYLDAEEFGLESYTEAYGDNPHLIASERKRLSALSAEKPWPSPKKKPAFCCSLT